MPSFSQKSQDNLNTCDMDLQDVFNEVVKHFDCTVLVGHRSQEAQTKAYNEGKSQKQYPDSKHNSMPSNAVDVAPYPIDWEDRDRFHYFAGYVMRTAKDLNVNLRWGGDWDNDTELKDNSFDDLVHFEIA